jgi:hypothetical protein
METAALALRSGVGEIIRPAGLKPGGFLIKDGIQVPHPTSGKFEGRAEDFFCLPLNCF